MKRCDLCHRLIWWHMGWWVGETRTFVWHAVRCPGQLRRGSAVEEILAWLE